MEVSNMHVTFCLCIFFLSVYIVELGFHHNSHVALGLRTTLPCLVWGSFHSDNAILVHVNFKRPTLHVIKLMKGHIHIIVTKRGHFYVFVMRFVCTFAARRIYSFA